MKEERRQAFFQADGNAAGRAGREGSEEKNEKGEDRSEKKRSRLREGRGFCGIYRYFPDLCDNAGEYNFTGQGFFGKGEQNAVPVSGAFRRESV